MAVSARRHAKVADLGSTAVIATRTTHTVARRRRIATGISCRRRSARSASRSTMSGKIVELRLDAHRPEGRRDAKRCRTSRRNLPSISRVTAASSTSSSRPSARIFSCASGTRSARDSVRRRAQLRRHRARNRPTESDARGGTSQRSQSPTYRHSVPPRDRQRRHDRRLFGGLDIKHRLLALESVELDL